jgi:hypothetical protein
MGYAYRDVAKVSMRLATTADQSLPAYDNTKLVAMNTCPTHASVSYGLNRRFKTNSRAMALEAGQACHEVFAAARVCKLYEHGLVDHFMHHGKRLFSQPGRFDAMLAYINETASGFDKQKKYLNFCLEALETSGFYDDPQDTRRTMSNLSEACLGYLDRYDFTRRPVWVENKDDPTSKVGVEVAFDMVVEFTMKDGAVRQWRFIGRCDGIEHDGRDDTAEVIVAENKTASRLNDAWSMAFHTSHQITGYMLGGSVFSGRSIQRAIVHGLSIPLPRTYDYGGIVSDIYSRTTRQFEAWFAWFLHTAQMWDEYGQNPTAAPLYTHSCNRYFRPCALIPLCAAESDEDKLEMINDEMVEHVWNPLDEKAAD